MKIIYSIKYDKKSAEYIIKFKKPGSSKLSRLFANGLDENEIIFCKTAKHKYEYSDTIIWC